MKKSSFYQDMVKPFIVLVVICIVTGALLAFTNHLTAPVIEENALRAAEETRRAMLPEAAGFEEIPVDPAWGVDVDNIYKDTGGSGFVITASSKGYGGDVVVTVGFDGEGVIRHMNVDASTETSGVGSKTADTPNIEKYLGRTGSVKDDATLLITSATFSSKAVRTAVQNALDAVAFVK